MKKSTSLVLFLALMVMACTESSKNTDYSTISGIWNCEEFDQYSNVRNYIVDIDNVVGYDNIFIISNFHKAGDDLFVRATVSENTLLIPQQAIGNYIVAGEGTITTDNKRINLQYTVNAGGGIKIYESVYYR